MTKLIPKGYSQFDNIEDIKNEIVKRVGNINLDFPKLDDIDKIKNDYKKNIQFSKLEEKININKERIKGGININVDSNENYKFYIELSTDKNEIFFYLNINNVINKKDNINPYLVKVILYDLNNNSKTIYLEEDKDNENENCFTFINSISRRELFNNYAKGFINLKIDFLDIN